ncbi:MAG: Gfo/Idh/MocA family oxidoreductase [Planctomycetaceae bacterium]|jgi:predicted dehydrogenase|nr:Gfo/Idh/MocA family oxidoreductase [Planctomycetaceae bacterium]
MNHSLISDLSRRSFINKTGAIAAGSLLASSFAPRVHAAGDDVIKIAIVGCGGRGGGAVRQALNAAPNVQLFAVADVFEDRLKGLVGSVAKNLAEQGNSKKFDVPAERQFLGFDAYKKAMDALSPGDVVLLTTPPAFRPLHFAYAVEKGLNIFAEKPIAVDIPGLKTIREANKKAIEKNLKVGVGLNNRHYARTAETVKAIHDGQIGDVLAAYVYRLQQIHSITPHSDRSPLEQQLRYLFNFNWTTGGFIVDALIHNLDICAWSVGQIPVAAQGQGGRLLRRDQDQLIDSSVVEYYFNDGRRMTMYARTMARCWGSFQGVVHGSKGSAVLGEGVGNPGLYKNFNAGKSGSGEPFWRASAPQNDSYQTEHNLLFKAIRENQTWNEIERGIDATFIPIMGRMAVESGQFVTADRAWNSTFQYVPSIENLSFDGPFPLVPDANGDYPQPIPGVTEI